MFLNFYLHLFRCIQQKDRVRQIESFFIRNFLFIALSLIGIGVLLFPVEYFRFTRVYENTESGERRKTHDFIMSFWFETEEPLEFSIGREPQQEGWKTAPGGDADHRKFPVSPHRYLIVFFSMAGLVLINISEKFESRREFLVFMLSDNFVKKVFKLFFFFAISMGVLYLALRLIGGVYQGKTPGTGLFHIDEDRFNEYGEDSGIEERFIERQEFLREHMD